MPVFIFPIAKGKDAMICEVAFKKLDGKFKTKNDDLSYREGMDGVFALQPDGTEKVVDYAEIWVHGELAFEPKDIMDGWSFGNGTTIGALTLKDGRQVSCAWIVISKDLVNLIVEKTGDVEKIFKDEWDAKKEGNQG